ncbi:ATPase, partial [Mesorhizobium sp. M7A.T.Ca.TU.009.01.1.2]
MKKAGLAANDGQGDAADALEFEYELAEPPEKVWRAPTAPGFLAARVMA